MYFLGPLLTNHGQARGFLTYALCGSSCTVRWSVLHIPSSCHLPSVTSFLVVKAKFNVCSPTFRSQGIISKNKQFVLILKYFPYVLYKPIHIKGKKGRERTRVSIWVNRGIEKQEECDLTEHERCDAKAQGRAVCRPSASCTVFPSTSCW